MQLTNKDKRRCIKRLYSTKKSEAKRRNKEFSLTLGLFSKLIQEPCIYCGAIESNILKYQGLYFAYNGIDRMNTKGDYDLGNAAPCCKFCNSLRGSMPFSLWSEFIDSVGEYRGKDRLFGTSRGKHRQRISFYKR